MKAALILLLVVFSLITGVAVWTSGIVGIWTPLLTTWAGVQVLVDLVIALALFLVWMWRDARASGRNPWPFLAITLAAGSFGPLLYLITRSGHRKP